MVKSHANAIKSYERFLWKDDKGTKAMDMAQQLIYNENDDDNELDIENLIL